MPVFEGSGTGRFAPPARGPHPRCTCRPGRWRKRPSSLVAKKRVGGRPSELWPTGHLGAMVPCRLCRLRSQARSVATPRPQAARSVRVAGGVWDCGPRRSPGDRQSLQMRPQQVFWGDNISLNLKTQTCSLLHEGRGERRHLFRRARGGDGKPPRSWIVQILPCER